MTHGLHIAHAARLARRPYTHPRTQTHTHLVPRNSSFSFTVRVNVITMVVLHPDLQDLRSVHGRRRRPYKYTYEYKYEYKYKYAYVYGFTHNTCISPQEGGRVNLEVGDGRSRSIASKESIAVRASKAVKAANATRTQNRRARDGAGAGDRGRAARPPKTHRASA